ncbi:MAG TPA: gliding motility-associated C-terminal domain-containing protein [Chitinophagales bacterium]|nr:gliding motility-associated C-terminal domain-containing protein [Chitinophagales bacterium]
MKQLLPLLFLLTSLCSRAQNGYWSNTGLVSIKDGAYLSVIGDCFNQGDGHYNNSDSIFLTGDWSHSANNRCFDSIDKGWVYLYAADQRIKGTTPTHFWNLVLKNQGVKYGDVDAYVDNLLYLNDRELNMDTSTMWVLNPALAAIVRTTGFVSSLKDGGLTRRTNQVQPYLYPLGSNMGTFRYRPVEFKPTATNENHYKARFANVDATAEGFDRNIKFDRICVINPLWYHRLYHISGNDSADISIMYDLATDGEWNDIVHWQNLPQWEPITKDVITPGTPFHAMTKFRWNNYNFAPFALATVSPLQFTGEQSNVTCYGYNNGFINTFITNADTAYTLLWNTGDTTQNINNLAPGVYTITLSEANRCERILTFTITQPDSIFTSFVTVDDTCYGSTNGSIEVTVTGGTPPYSFLWDSTITTQNIYNLGARDYALLVTDSQQCFKRDVVTINQPPPVPYLVAGVDTILWRSDTIQLNSFLGSTYSWQPAYNISCTDCNDPMIWPDTNTTYYLTLTDDIGCHFKDSVRVMVRDKPFALFFIPNAITPDNGDGYNDYWHIRDLERYPDNEVRIVNRWGDEVFFQAPYQNDWTGTWKGEKLPGATYYYIIKIRFNGEVINFDGPLTIIR